MSTPSRRQKSVFPPLPLPCKNSSRSSTREDTITIGKTASPSVSVSPTEFSFQTPSTKASSPGTYAWSISSKKAQGEKKQSPIFVVDGQQISPVRRKESPPPWRHSPYISKNNRAPSPCRAPPKYRHRPRSTSPTLRHDPIKFQRNESILDLTDSEDEDDSVVADSSLRQLIRVTSLTLSQKGKMLEEESYIELEPTGCDQEDDGLNKELSQLRNNEEACHNEISVAIDKVAYGHQSAPDWSDKFVSNQGKVVNIQALDNAQKEDSTKGFIDKIIGICVCCGNNPGPFNEHRK